MIELGKQLLLPPRVIVTQLLDLRLVEFGSLRFSPLIGGMGLRFPRMVGLPFSQPRPARNLSVSRT
ncbi:MAG: hypothetical protein VX969_08195, partial [Verrucomicrobiota bacterium]|nr:hypothetical protein [Verrucomicrobiota bacterium]